MIGAGATARVEEDWHLIWSHSEEHRATMKEIDSLQNHYRALVQADNHLSHQASPNLRPSSGDKHPNNPNATSFAMPWFSQYKAVQFRMLQTYWRSPVYILGKLVLNIWSGLFVGFTFYKENDSVAGLQNKLFAVFMSVLISFPLMNQLQPSFMSIRDVYEAREKPSKLDHWATFILSILAVEFFWNCICATIIFFP